MIEYFGGGSYNKNGFVSLNKTGDCRSCSQPGYYKIKGEKEMKDFGVLVPIVTPCTKEGKIDYAGLESVSKFMLDAGCAGIFGAGSTGRGPWFQLKDQVKICETIKAVSGDKAKVFMGCTATSFDQMVENAKAHAAAGADIAVITAPGYFSYNIQETAYILNKFVEESPIPVLIYDIPEFAGQKLSLDTLTTLANHPNVAGIKDSSADSTRFNELIETFRDNDEIMLLQGKELILAESLLNGASGLVVSFLHMDPRPFVAIYNACKAGNVAEAQRLQAGIAEVFHKFGECTKQRYGISTLFHILNYCLQQHGVCDNILMPHETQEVCPDWLMDKAKEIYKLSTSIL